MHIGLAGCIICCEMRRIDVSTSHVNCDSIAQITLKIYSEVVRFSCN